MLLAAILPKQTGRKNLESQSAIFLESYAALMQSRIKANGDCAPNQQKLCRKLPFKIPTSCKSLTAAKVVSCELKIERNVCRS